MNISEKKAGVLLNYAMLISNVMVKFLYTPFLLRLLGQAEYGLYSLIITVVGYLTILDLGFGNAVTRFTVKYNSERNCHQLYRMYSTLSVVYILIGITAFVICICLSYASDSMFGYAMTSSELQKIKLMIFLCGINLLFCFPLQISSSILIAYERFIFKNSVHLVVCYLQPITMILLMYLVHIKSVGAVVVVTSFNLITYISFYVYAKKYLNFRVSLRMFDKDMIRPLLSFSLAMFCMAIFEKIQFQSGQFVLGMTNGSKTIAIWGISMVFVLNFRTISTAITNVLTPSFFVNSFNNNTIKQQESICRMIRVQTYILSFVLFNFIIFGKQFLTIWAGNSYIEAYNLSVIMMVPLFVALLLEFCYIIQMARNKLRYRILTLYGSYFFSFFIIWILFGLNLKSFAYITGLSIIVAQVFFVLIYIIKHHIISLQLVSQMVLKIMYAPSLCSIACYFIIFLIPFTIEYFVLEIIVYNIFMICIYWFVAINKDDHLLLNRKTA